ncbi:G surface protein, allelic form 156-like [Uranotaenia lowii]|uniref:G surface protein, allelic form 156-like n=1 Tax=Uranotaenia lowii TaxID=190385 RepID=UPI00247AE8BB|nr:G surface protein, allelic form 156-like [Uranotaenia lowii]
MVGTGSSLVPVVLILASFWTAGFALDCYSCTGNGCVDQNTYLNIASCAADVTGCYAKFTGLTVTERGCKLDTVECTTADCEECQTDECNGLSVPTHTCVSCSSVVDTNCVGSVQSIAPSRCDAVTIDVTENQCYTRVIGGVTERGCVVSNSELDAANYADYSETCTGEGCNTGIVPITRQKCVKCVGSSCDTVTTIDSNSYCDYPDDGCVVLRRTDGIYYKNCQMAMSTSDQQLCSSQSASCAFCIGQECNTKDLSTLKAAGERMCHSCMGTNCLRASVTLETCANSDDDCYVVFEEYNAVQRGCVSSITDEVIKNACQDDTDDSCIVCSTDECNLISSKNHQCFYCSSVLNTNCITGTGISSIACPAPTTEVTEDAQCYTRVLGMVTERGCLGSPTDDLLCKPGENCETCKITNGAACNSGLYPAARIKCVIGSTANAYCGNPTDSCAQISQNSVITKKCKAGMTADEVSYCAANSNKCSFCSGDNCNQQDINFNYIECLTCNSADSTQCLASPLSIGTIETCSSSCATVMGTNAAGAQYIRRGCQSSLSEAEKQICTGSNSNCVTCTGNRCNTGIVPQSRLACYTCLGGNCFSQQTISLQYCPSYVENDSCVVLMDSQDLLVSMGCKSSLSTQQAAACNNNPASCKTCSESQCNAPSKYIPRAACVHCSSISDPDCQHKASSFEAEPCADPLNTKCYSRFTSSGAIERGCLADLVSNDRVRCLSGVDCLVCSSPTGTCNNLEYPVNPEQKLQCYQCVSTQDQTCKGSQIGKTLNECSTFNSQNQCYTIVAANGDTVRKCSTQSRDVECAGSQLCEVCKFNGCNNRPSTEITPYNTTTTTPAPTKCGATGLLGAGSSNLFAVLATSLLMVVASSIFKV